MSDYFWLIPLVPGVGALVNGLFGKRLSKPMVNLVALGAVALSFLIALGCFFGPFLSGGGETVLEKTLFTWIPGMSVAQADGSLKDFTAEWQYRLDSLSMVMVLIVTGIGLLIHIYSVGYMSQDEGYWRFFTYLNLFTFFMLNLVLGANFLIMFVGWEGVGLCSYLLIGFWFERHSAAQAGKKAFVVNRIGDAGFILAIMMIFYHFGSVDFYQVMQSVADQFEQPSTGLGVLSIIGILLFVGAAGKSAQIPLYVWLPDAMEGPTPVSALIHAATMVTAGVYMIARSAVLYQNAPVALGVVAIVGVLTALFAATIGLFQNDIKKVLAYSTVSQLGYMFLGLGVGAFGAAIFHLMTHAFFKACLFLGSGSVIHSMEHAEHESGGHRDYSEMQDMRNMGGLKKFMPRTHITYFLSTLAIAGIFPFAGFFSKDEILWAASHEGHVTLLWIAAVIAAGMTAFYMFRQFYLTFHGSFRGGEAMQSHLHESPSSMTIPLVVLAIGACVAGLVGIPFGYSLIGPFLQPALDAGMKVQHEIHHAAVSVEIAFMSVSLLVATGGIFLARKMYRGDPHGDKAIMEGWPAIHRLLYNKYFVDEVYQSTVVGGTLSGARGLHSFDVKVVDGAVNGAAKVTLGTADASYLADTSLVDGAVNALWKILASFSQSFRRLQTGVLQNYALMMLIGIFALISYFYFYLWN